VSRRTQPQCEQDADKGLGGGGGERRLAWGHEGERERVADWWASAGRR
jgi:hypothetical protein